MVHNEERVPAKKPHAVLYNKGAASEGSCLSPGVSVSGQKSPSCSCRGCHVEQRR